jgi:hypothetical protein
LHALLQRAPDLAVALDQEHPGLVAVASLAQPHEVLDAGILEAGDAFGRDHGRI